MPSGSSFIAFVAAALVVLLIPGPGVLYGVALAAGQGYRAGLVSAAGLSAGALVHVFAATGGLSNILLASAHSLHIVKIPGAGYLVYLGLSILIGGRLDAKLQADRVAARRKEEAVVNRGVADFALFIALLAGIAVTINGAILARFRPAGMAHALYATAAAQA